MSAAHEALDAVQYLMSTGVAGDLARSMGEAFAQGFAAEAAKLDKVQQAAPALHAVAAGLVKYFGDVPPEEFAIMVAEDPSSLGMWVDAARAALAKAEGRAP